MAAAALVILAGCVEIKDDTRSPLDAASASASPPVPGIALASLPGDTADITAPSYELYPLDTAGLGQQVPADLADSSAKAITAKSTDVAITRFPARIPAQGPVALQIQILLDRANFSPGIVDGAWGSNAAKALAYFTDSESSTAGASSDRKSQSTIDRPTYARLRAAAGPEAALKSYTLTAEDVKGPFVQIPNSVYEQARLRCLCYSSAVEAIAEKFHTAKKLLAQLNPKVKLDDLKAGMVLVVPGVDNERRASAADTIPIARLIVSRSGFWTQAVDASGRVLFHFPSTLGAGYDPSPAGDFKVVSVAYNPSFHYQPKLFAEVPDSKPEARLPPGPNSPVGVVWIGLSKPHYGIHGTSSPETIGYANSHGCVRLTNWDAEQLSDLVESGTPVEFR